MILKSVDVVNIRNKEVLINLILEMMLLNEW